MYAFHSGTPICRSAPGCALLDESELGLVLAGLEVLDVLVVRGHVDQRLARPNTADPQKETVDVVPPM